MTQLQNYLEVAMLDFHYLCIESFKRAPHANKILFSLALPVYKCSRVNK